MSIYNDPKSWSQSSNGIRRLRVGHITHEYQKGKCAKCKTQSNKLDSDPMLGWICPTCMIRAIDARDPKPFSAWIYKLNGKEVRVKQVFAASHASLNIELGNYVYTQTRVKQDVVWETNS